MKPTYLFYDIETTGLNKCFDQVLQFACIRTDHELNELSRDEIHIKLNPDVVPSPAAIITHRIGPKEFTKGLSEYDGIKKIHALLNTPNTISVGYNTLGFDDEFLRFSFYKNLLSPYTHQYTNQCGRMDMYPITLLYYLFKRDHLQWPNKEGTINLKLENLNACNQFFKGQAHNAMVDVEVTLALARQLFLDQKMWAFVIDYFHKKTDEERISGNTFGFMVNGKIGSASQFIAPVMHLGQHQHYKNQSLWLRLDEPNLTTTLVSGDGSARAGKREEPINITEHTRVFKKRLGEPPIFLPMKDRYFNLLSIERKNNFEKNKIWLENNVDTLKSITHYYQHEKYPDVPERDIDAALYTIGFPTPVEEKWFQQFHAAKPAEKEAIAMRIPNATRREQAIRIIGRHFPDYLSEENKHYFDAYLKSQPIDFRGEKKLTRENALIEIDDLLKNKVLDDEQRRLLMEFQNP